MVFRRLVALPSYLLISLLKICLSVNFVGTMYLCQLIILIRCDVVAAVYMSASLF